MYVIGHFVVTEKSNAFNQEEVFGDKMFALMLPDYVRCHDWGYEKCFDYLPSTLEGLLIRAHILGDWYVHFGEITKKRKKTGWVYHRMGVYAQHYDDFFANASRLGLREPTEPADSLRGFSHTMMEYTIDTFLARCGEFDIHFAAVKTALGTLGIRDGIGSAHWINETIYQEKITANSPDLQADVESFRNRIAQSKMPEDIAFRAGAKKFHLHSCDESVDYVRKYVDIGLSEIPSEELNSIVEETAKFVGCWTRHFRS